MVKIFVFMTLISLSISLLSSMSTYLKRVGERRQKIFGRASSRESSARIGGVCVFLSLSSGVFFLNEDGAQTLLFLLSSMFVPFFFGLIDDVYIEVSPFLRLITSVLAGAFLCYLLETKITNLGFESIGFLISHPIGQFGLTVIAIALSINSFNIVDGLNGLMLGTFVIIIIALSVITSSYGLDTFTQLCCIFAGSAIGLFLVNYPRGLIFSGDSGSYLLGGVTAWAVIELNRLDLGVSAFLSLLLVAYPIYETLRTVLRRFFFNVSLFKPDRNHLHYLLHDFVATKIEAKNWKINAISSTLMLIFPLITSVFSIIYHRNEKAILVGFSLFVVLYESMYFFLKIQKRRNINNFKKN